MAALILTSKQRSALRALAHALQPVVQVGQAGSSATVIEAVRDALVAHELIKVRLHAPANKKAMAAQLAEATDAALCGLIGHTVILYKPHPEKPRIHV